MKFEELQQVYGTLIAKRIEHELTREECAKTHIDDLPEFLQQRAEKAEKRYREWAENPLERSHIENEMLHKRWKAALDLSAVVSVAHGIAQDQSKVANGD